MPLTMSDMKQRSKDYMSRKKAQTNMCHPQDLKSFLIDEYNSSRNIIVKKDILHMINDMEDAGVQETDAVQNRKP